MTAPAQPPVDPAVAVDPAPEPAPVDPDPRPEDAGRLSLDQALAELDRATPAMLAVENEHGFIFGGPVETGPGRHAAAVVCVDPTCGQRGRHVQILDDTVQPVHCGGCGTVLHCDHVQELRRYRAGTIGAPVEVTVTECTVCGTELSRVEVPQPPVNLADLPVSILDQPLDRS